MEENLIEQNRDFKLIMGKCSLTADNNRKEFEKRYIHKKMIYNNI